MEVNKKLLPVKGHFFLFNAGTAPLVPYLSSYARQLGFSSSTVGLIYTVLPIFGLIAKPMFGIIADKFKIQKPLFLVFQLSIILSFSAIYFVPANNVKVTIDMDCGDSASIIRSCYQDVSMIDQCAVTSLSKMNTTDCRMKCKMSTPAMWQTVCEHWHMPHFCYEGIDSIFYTAQIDKVKNQTECLTIGTKTVGLDGLQYEPRCRDTPKHVTVNEECSFECVHQSLNALINNNTANMTCIGDSIKYRLCHFDSLAYANVVESKDLGYCEMNCDISSPYVLMEICETWNAGVARTCQVANEYELPDHLTFESTILLSNTLTEHKCVYIEMEKIVMADGSIHYPYCGPKADYEVWPNEFHSQCEIDCDEQMVNDLFKSASESTQQESPYTQQFWVFFTLMIISWIGQAVVVTFADAICFNILGTKVSQYGKQRLWGSVGFGIFSLLTGTLIDLMSDGAYKNYMIAFILMIIFMLGDMAVSYYIEVDSTIMSLNIISDVGTLLTSVSTVVYLLWTIAVGLCTGLIWQFLFWHIEDVAGLTCDGSEYVKTLQGLVSAIQTFGGEIPFMFISGRLLKLIGHEHAMCLVLGAFGIRFILYSYLTNAWWILPIELFQGITFGMFYPTMTSYANIISPPGTETTVQGLVGAIFEGVGTSLGSFIGGKLYESYGGWITFRSFGIAAIFVFKLHATALYFIKKRTIRAGLNEGYPTTVRYNPGTDEATVHILSDVDDD